MGALNASGHIRRPKPARSSRRARLLIAGLVVAVWTSKCCSCKTRIAVGDDCKPFPRWRNVSDYSDPEVVVRIYGEGGEMPLPTWYLCDRCAGLYESLDSLGFCGMLGDNLVQTCREYGQMQRDAGVFRGQMVVTPNRHLWVGLEPPPFGWHRAKASA